MYILFYYFQNMKMEDIIMAWCPICKNEYDDAVNICNDCNCLLLKGNPDDFKELLVDKNEEIVLNAFNDLTENNFESAQYYCDEKEIYHLLIATEDFDDANHFLVAGDKEELVNAEDLYAPANDASGTIPSGNVSTKKKVRPYVKLSEKVSDLRSSAFSLLIIGVIGAAFLILEKMGVISLNFTATAHSIFYIVMGIMFGAFIVFGIMSLISMYKLMPLAKKHTQLTEDILNYAKESFSKENADKAIELSVASANASEVDDLLYYYQRSHLIRTFIKDKYDVEDESFEDYLVEEIYSMYWGDDDVFENEELVDENTDGTGFDDEDTDEAKLDTETETTEEN